MNNPKDRVKKQHPEKRKRISTACDTCKRRKFKCTGEKPCAKCKKRDTSCTYTVIDKRSLKGERLAKLKLQKKTQAELHEPQYKEAEDTIENKYIPKSLQPLLSFPLENDVSSSYTGEIFDGVFPVVLLNSFGDFKYFGETSPVSLLFECKEIFTRRIGNSIFSKRKEIVFDESPVFIENFQPVELPSRFDMEELLLYFKFNINDTYFVLDFSEFCNTVVNSAYQDIGGCNKRNLALLYLVGSLGLLFKGFSRGTEYISQARQFLEHATVLLREIPEDGSLWLVQVYFLIHFYYQVTSNRTTSWLNLGISIRYAQSLGMHRRQVNLKVCKSDKEIEYREKLFRSLYICDRVTSVFLGRPLSIHDYEWEEADKNSSSLDFYMKCQLELADLSKIIGRIMELFYNEKSIDFNISKDLAIELKRWSMKLDKELQVDNIIHWKLFHDDTLRSQHNNYMLLLVHLLQLYGIMILSRPFLIFEVTSSHKPQLKENFRYGKLSSDFYIAGVKSSILTVKLINYFVNSNRKKSDSYVIISCCAFATYMIGIKLIHGEFENEPYSTEELMECLRMSIHILSFYEPFNCGAKIFLDEAKRMEQIIQSHINKAEKTRRSIDFIGNLNFIDDQTYNLETLKGFQQFFV